MSNEYIANELTLTREQIKYGLIKLGIIIFLVFGWLWWIKVYQNPIRVFWDMFGVSLNTSDVTRHIVESSNGQKVDETVQLELGKTKLAHLTRTVAQGTNIFSTETISTPSVYYTRYTSLHIVNNGKTLNSNSVLNIWSKSALGNSSGAVNDFFSLLGSVPVGFPTTAQRQALLKQIKAKRIFVPDFSKVQHKTISGQRADVYNVTIEPAAYVALMQTYAKDEGLGTLTELEASNYKNASSFEVQFAINPISRRLVQISSTGSNHIETYSAYGQQLHVNLPTKTITTDALQQRLAAIQ